MSDLKGLAILVTGASTGIGAASAIALAEAGADVGVGFFRSEAAVKEVASKVEKAGRRALLLKADLTDSKQVDAMTDRFVGEFGRIDAVFANAGALKERRLIAETSDELWREIFSVNVDSVFYTVRAALRHMLPAKRGSVIVDSSIAARTGGGGKAVHYASAKGALVTFVKGLAGELATEGIRVNAVGPGVIETPFHDKSTEPARMRAFKGIIPLKKYGAPDDIARAVVWLAGETSGFITGETIYISGGM